jgi:hypothetical protein
MFLLFPTFGSAQSASHGEGKGSKRLRSPANRPFPAQPEIRRGPALDDDEAAGFGRAAPVEPRLGEPHGHTATMRPEHVPGAPVPIEMLAPCLLRFTRKPGIIETRLENRKPIVEPSTSSASHPPRRSRR